MAQKEEKRTSPAPPQASALVRYSRVVSQHSSLQGAGLLGAALSRDDDLDAKSTAPVQPRHAMCRTLLLPKTRAESCIGREAEFAFSVHCREGKHALLLHMAEMIIHRNRNNEHNELPVMLLMDVESIHPEHSGFTKKKTDKRGSSIMLSNIDEISAIVDGYLDKPCVPADDKERIIREIERSLKNDCKDPRECCMLVCLQFHAPDRTAIPSFLMHVLPLHASDFHRIYAGACAGLFLLMLLLRVVLV